MQIVVHFIHRLILFGFLNCVIPKCTWTIKVLNFTGWNLGWWASFVCGRLSSWWAYSWWSCHIASRSNWLVGISHVLALLLVLDNVVQQNKWIFKFVNLIWFFQKSNISIEIFNLRGYLHNAVQLQMWQFLYRKACFHVTCIHEKVVKCRWCEGILFI